ncbi:hypothetical protein E5676_scaffold129G00430 [Cucumis melo var. makuwa]|uniref:Uncharacterized protein n=1 Tax=Cucumis melo var. makuwa TaxID=1194695 RepID=A0A5D3E1R5_CUCMM|nr:hypothetical protein E6C27_scaffold110G001580 [Cucumis melo var. makuwa]TYK29335.1 hypothetical protein E5676_scaffold129G00430 [Cucumis melo var. makuwa]
MAPTLEEEVKEHKDESDSIKNYRHWKRPLKKAKVPGDNPNKMGSSALEVSDVLPLSLLNDHLEGLIELDSNESLTGPHAVDSTFEEVVTLKTLIIKPVKQSLHLSTLLEKIRRGKMTVEEKDIESPPSKEDEDIQDKIMQTPFKYIPRLRPEIATILSGIEKIHTDDLTPLEEYLNNKARQLDEKTPAIKEALTLMKQLQGDAKVIKEKVIQLSLEKKKLERRLQSINDEPEKLSILYCEKAEAIDQQELEVAKLQDEVNALKSTPAITEETIKAQATVRKSMEAILEEFKNFKWKL